MISIYLTDCGRLLEQDQICPGAWIHMSAPNEKEIGRVCAQLHVDPDLVRASLDEEERSRIEQEDGTTLILVDTPVVDNDGHATYYSTIPFGIILTGENIITVCLKDAALPRAVTGGQVKNCSTKKQKRMALQFLYRNSTLFLTLLRQIDKASNQVENELHKSMQNKELIQMLEIGRAHV